MNEIKHNELINKEDKKTYRYLNYTEHLLILASTAIGCVSVSAFVSIAGISIRITSSAVGLKVCVINLEIKKY